MHQDIPDGPASVYLKLAAAVAALIAAVNAIRNGDHSETTLAAGLTAAAFLVTFAAGKYAQAAAALRNPEPHVDGESAVVPVVDHAAKIDPKDHAAGNPGEGA